MPEITVTDADIEAATPSAKTVHRKVHGDEERWSPRLCAGYHAILYAIAKARAEGAEAERESHKATQERALEYARQIGRERERVQRAEAVLREIAYGPTDAQHADHCREYCRAARAYFEGVKP